MHTYKSTYTADETTGKEEPSWRCRVSVWEEKLIALFERIISIVAELVFVKVLYILS